MAKTQVVLPLPIHFAPPERSESSAAQRQTRAGRGVQVFFESRRTVGGQNMPVAKIEEAEARFGCPSQAKP
jgi:hypothetical protein